MMKNSKANGISRKPQPQPQKRGGGIIIKAEIEEIRVCTNRTCRKQGSLQTLQTLSAIAPPNVTINSCACLGRCGSGPNLIALPNANPVIVGHCGTAARAAQIMVRLLLCDHNDAAAARLSLEALALSKTAQSELDQSNFSQAELLLSQAIDLKPFGGIHILHKDRSRARLALGNYSGALEDAREALKFAPHYTEAYICLGDAFLSMDQFDSAENSYLTCLEIDPLIRRSKSFKARIAKLQEKLAAANMP
ncbi:small glutamine-rich tetratricopeptide repeat-containing protein 2 isoform X2 [Fagus crenata]